LIVTHVVVARDAIRVLDNRFVRARNIDTVLTQTSNMRRGGGSAESFPKCRQASQGRVPGRELNLEKKEAIVLESTGKLCGRRCPVY